LKSPVARAISGAGLGLWERAGPDDRPWLGVCRIDDETTSSRLIRKEFAAKLNRVYRKPVFWSRSYCIISCGGAPLSILKQYIEQQASPE
jgi:hypothetical protein